MKVYTRDWLNNRPLQRCSMEARCLWHEMRCLMNEGVPYGHLADDSGPVTEQMLARVSGVKPVKVHSLLCELEENKVLHRTEAGTIFDPQLVEEEKTHHRRTLGGYLSVLHPATQKPKQVGTVNGGIKGGLDGDHVGSPSEVTIYGTVDGGSRAPERTPARFGSNSSSSISLLRTETTNTETRKVLQFLCEQFVRVLEEYPNPTEVDEGCRVWISLVDMGEITEVTLPEVFEGLERWKKSEQWKQKRMIHSVKRWLFERRWKDHPKQPVTGWEDL